MDDRCVTMLSRLADAMAEDSTILTDDMIMPFAGASLRATELDMTMMTLFSVKERTLSEWKELLARTGKELSVRRAVEYYEEYHYGIIEVVKDGK